ncbi:hypothetical protein ACIBQX_36870 [Nonomuraea sp. NPDC049714]|uniref:hypothetical protein n=1 Tax=Nonomuraea sp. NPDC049714 TaxID=3364357 RepID=UPI0037B91A49
MDRKEAPCGCHESGGCPVSAGEWGDRFSLVHATQFFEFAHAIADEATVDGKVHIAPVRFQPMAGDDVAQAVARVAVGSPLNGRVEVAGPEQFRMDEFFRIALAAWEPGDGATLGQIRYRDWLDRATTGK